MKAALGLLLLILMGASSCAPTPKDSRRPADPCRCKEENAFETCRCLHCEGEAGARCYCNQGGCRCGTRMPSCACLHCTGVPGAGACDCFSR